MLFRARAPVRIDFAGGWTDVALFTEESKGLVVNTAINIYSFATVACSDGQDDSVLSESNNASKNGIRLYSADFDVGVEAPDISQLRYDGKIDLVKAATRKMLATENGFSLSTQSIAPPESGLGTSAAMGVALVGVLSTFKESPLLPYEYAELASSIERHELGILGGKQDHYASAVGGINFMEFMGEEVKTSSLKIAPEVQYELEKNLVLCYSGRSRPSGNIHQNVTDAYLNKEAKTRAALRNMKEIAKSAKTALISGRLSDFGQLLNENWANQKTLHPSVTNEHIDHLFDTALGHGAIGGKACGAGGGGCLVFYCEADQEHLVRQKLEESGARIIDFNFDFDGLQTWRVN
ncbi:MAG: GHMP kinase [Candidatus Poribacteria bacterium]|nr:GHMP kinase [Candidatus Poribacteria bacterium]MDE0506902.1 GHMP kinase [Candidatus Poribacteria bacterium]